MAQRQHRFIQDKKPAEGVSRLGGFIGEEKSGKGWGEFFRCGLAIVLCWGGQETGS
jgi:hypothetical protein